MAIFFVLINLGVLSCVGAFWNLQPPGLSILQNNHHQQQFPGPGNVGQNGWGNVPGMPQGNNHFPVPKMPAQYGWNPPNGDYPHARPNFPLQQHYGSLSQHAGHPQQHFVPSQWQQQGNSQLSGRRMDPALHRMLFGHDTSEQSESSEEFPGKLGHGGLDPVSSEEELPGMPSQGLQGQRPDLDDEDDDSESDESQPIPDRLPGSRRSPNGLPSPAELAAELAELLKGPSNDEDPNMLEAEDLDDEDEDDDDEHLAPMQEPPHGMEQLIPLITGENGNPMRTDDEDSASNEDDYRNALLPDNLPSPSEEVHITDDPDSGEPIMLQDDDDELVTNCRDKRPDCGDKKKLCNDTNFAYLMAQHCADHCGICKLQREEREKDKEQECKDASNLCAIGKPFCNTFLFGMFTKNACPKTCSPNCNKEDTEVGDPNDAVDSRQDVLNQLMSGDPQGFDGPEPEHSDLEELPVPEDDLEDEDDSEDGPDGEQDMPPDGDQLHIQDDDLDDLPQPDNLPHGQHASPRLMPLNPRGPPLEAQLSPQAQPRLSPQAQPQLPPQSLQEVQSGNGEQPEDSPPVNGKHPAGHQ